MSCQSLRPSFRVINSRITSFRNISQRCKAALAILGITNDENSISYDDVKKAFVKQALKHHPDRSTGSSAEFVKVRRAFESVKELPDGSCLIIGEDEMIQWTDQSLSDWFLHETGQPLSFHMNSATRKEVAEVANTMQQSGLDRGGMWEMARMIAQEEADCPSRPEPKQLEEPKTTSRRRRR
mmetsp:Transcript_10629/g.15644  ORF Transcript_10629/g.15644 Transcript_10629/m.15644 type:complete len:182 (+) Transcript_10629:376-921(+)|eukprot:CAMPEP_0194212246 /NCGR_PEP_ID=MMETSP0156-20130528/11943_1 /TAXON_ID=33649 /ORGANISM="Thalassionema nitzschioides, Strain L26-B" /LENGTH=181 /DNA_ID=CAMNT_0038940023 /DNA_START=329 /DNA_END=874 /DNA_ORIENTATION=-